MADPVTIGTVGALALGMAYEAIVKGVVGEVVKDAYKSVKSLFSNGGEEDIAKLEHDPQSPARRAVVAEFIDGLPEAQREQVSLVIDKLTAVLQQAEVTQGATGLDISGLTAANLRLQEIRVSEGTGVRIRDTQLQGDLSVGAVTVGSTQGKSAQ